jgi:hypothetical protein
MSGVAALSRLAVFIDTSVCRNISIETVLFFSFTAVLTFAAGVNHTSDPYPVTDLILCDLFPYTSDNSCNLMSRHEWIVYGSPFAVSGMDVRMAYACIFNFN